MSAILFLFVFALANSLAHASRFNHSFEVKYGDNKYKLLHPPNDEVLCLNTVNGDTNRDTFINGELRSNLCKASYELFNIPYENYYSLKCFADGSQIKTVSNPCYVICREQHPSSNDKNDCAGAIHWSTFLLTGHKCGEKHFCDSNGCCMQEPSEPHLPIDDVHNDVHNDGTTTKQPETTTTVQPETTTTVQPETTTTEQPETTITEQPETTTTEQPETTTTEEPIPEVSPDTETPINEIDETTTVVPDTEKPVTNEIPEIDTPINEIDETTTVAPDPDTEEPETDTPSPVTESSPDTHQYVYVNETTTTPTPPTVTISPTHIPRTKHQCLSSGYFVDKINPKLYYFCKYFATIHACAPDEQFDPTHNQCVFDQSTEDPAMEFFKWKSAIHCTAPGTFRSPYNCKYFYTCVQSHDAFNVYFDFCFGDLVFNESTGQCDYKKHRCNNMLVLPEHQEPDLML